MNKSLLNYTEFSIVIHASNIFVDTTREWFLRTHAILDENAVVEDLGDSMPFATGIRTDRHVRIFAEPDRLEVRQEGFALRASDNQIEQIMLKYLNVVPVSQCSGIGINFTGVLVTGERSKKWRPLSRLFVYRGNWAKHGETIPSIDLDVRYILGSREANITMEDVESVDSPVQQGVMFTGNIQRDLPKSDNPLNNSLSRIVSGWRRDMALFEEIVVLFKSRLVRP